jgi:hypothetical protein
MVIGDKTFYSRRHFLLAAVALAGSAILAACGGGTAIPTSGANPGCKPISKMVATDNSQIQALQSQKANTGDPAKKMQIDTQIAGKRQDIASLQQQAKQLGCP